MSVHSNSCANCPIIRRRCDETIEADAQNKGRADLNLNHKHAHQKRAHILSDLILLQPEKMSLIEEEDFATCSGNS